MVVFSRLARIRGSAFEACLKALAVGEYHGVEPVRPESIFVGQRQRVFDADVMTSVWEITQKVKRGLAKLGFRVRFAQQTYHRRKPKASLSVALPLLGGLEN